MSEPENFLSRWSRRKIEAEHKEEEPQRTDDTAANEAARARESQAADPPATDAKPDKPEDEAPEFDITTLPSLESIDAATDIRGFLQKGVPADLTRAALRRAWIADPNIRDFIEVAENQWDFATGSDIPGFGALEASPEDIRRMVADIFGEGRKPPVEAEADANAAPSEAETPTDAAQSETTDSSAEQSQRQEIAATDKDEPPPEHPSIDPAQDIVRRNEVDVALRQTVPDSEHGVLPTRRTHGRALPE